MKSGKTCTVLQPLPMLIVHYAFQLALHYCSLCSYVVIIKQNIEHFLWFKGEVTNL